MRRKSRYRVIASLLVFLLSQGQITPLIAQELQITPNSDRNSKLDGSSFRTREEDRRWKPASPFFPEKQVLGAPPIDIPTYQVHVLGEVSQPGTHRIVASTRLSEALQLAGGVLDSGSERWIELRREEGSRRVDYLSFKLFGNLDANPYLLDSDVIFVPLKKKSILVEGAVKRPGSYELKNEKNAEDAIRLAGNFSPGAADLAPIKVIRFRDGFKEVIDVENSSRGRRGFRIENADVVLVSHILTEEKKFDYNVDRLPGDRPLFYPSYDAKIFVLGAVEKPGAYTYNPYYDVRQYVTLAGGTSRLSKPKKIKLLTSEGKTFKANEKTEINPGDTIVVPERYMAPETFLTLVLGVTTSIVSTVAVVVSLTRK